MTNGRRPRGQGLVEFALILPALLMIVLSIIEGALLFQSYMAIQHAAREAARYAVTYQPPITYSEEQGQKILNGEPPGTPDYPNETKPEWYERRLVLIKQRAFDQAKGIRIMAPSLTEDAFAANQSTPGFFGVRVQGFPKHDEEAIYDHPSLPGLPVRVEVHYRWQPIDPLIGAIWPQGVPLMGEAIMINEGIQVGVAAVAPPTFPPVETVGAPTSTPTPLGGTPQTPTVAPTPSSTPTQTPTPTATPAGAYIILDPEHEPWLEEELPGGQAIVYNHPDPGPYRVYWTDNCGTRTYLGFELTTLNETASHGMPTGFPYLHECGGVPLEQERTYTCTLSTDLAETQVPIFIPRQRPDLLIRNVILPPELEAGLAITVGIEIENTEDVPVSGTFDIDIYIDPSHEPVLQGQPGQGTMGGSSPKQWQVDMDPYEVRVVYYVMVLPASGDHTLWAQVDTSDYIDELDDENNVAGPIDVSLACSTYSDDFDSTFLDGKWILSDIGTAAGVGQARIEDEELVIYGTGSSLWNSTDGKFQLLHQGDIEGDFEMTVRVTDFPRGRSSAKAGLMVRSSTAVGAPYFAVTVRAEDGWDPHIQVFERTRQDYAPEGSCASNVPIPDGLFDPGGGGVWLRIIREGATLTGGYSLDGEDWQMGGCMETTISSMGATSVPGIMLASY